MANYKIDLSQKSTLADKIYEHVKKLILMGEFKPDQRITIKELADYFNVSITPVREATQRLIAEKYFVISPKSEIKVIGISLAEIKKVFELNKALDLYGVETNLKNFSDETIDELEKMSLKLKEYYEKDNKKLYFKQTMKIHHRIWHEYNNAFIHQSLVNAEDLISIFARLYFNEYYNSNTIRKSYQDHMDLLVAIKNKDIEFAKKILVRHWDKLFDKDRVTEDGQNKK